MTSEQHIIVAIMDMCYILSWTTMWVFLAVWEVSGIITPKIIPLDIPLQIMKMALMVIARYNFIFTRPR